MTIVETNPEANSSEDTADAAEKPIGHQLEERIVKFLKELEFKDVDGARNTFRINNVQVDACGGWENALLVIECKSKQKLGRKSLRSAIGEFRGKIPILRKGFAEHPIYKKYTYIKFILIARNIELRREDIEYANEQPSIYIWSDDFLEYYADLYKFIKPYAKYDLLGEMRIAPIYRPPIRIPALRTKQKNLYVYTFVMNPKDLLEVSFVARRDVRRERYYQRIIDEKRLSKIASYIEGGGFFPNNIIIAFRDDLQVKFSPESDINDGLQYGILEFPKDYRSCWIIDGQHRLYSFVNLKEDFYFNMPVTAFENLDIKEQRKFFLDINKNQKPVDSDLLWDLSGDVPSEKEGILSNIAKTLNTYFTSPLFHGIYYPSSGIKDKRGKLKISAICTAMKNNKIVNDYTLDNVRNPLYNADAQVCMENFAKSLMMYFAVIADIFPRNWTLKNKGYILTNGGVAVMLGLYEKIVARASQKMNRAPNRDFFIDYLRPLIPELENVDAVILKKLRLSTTSEGGRSDLITNFVIAIRHATKDNLFGGEVKESQLSDEFKELEKKIKELIYKKCHQDDVDWFKAIADEYTYKEARNRLAKSGDNDLDNLYLQTTLGQCFGILRNKKDIFYPVFTDEEKEYSFSNEKMLETAITIVSEVRNRSASHYTGVKAKADEEMIARTYLDKLNYCLDAELVEVGGAEKDYAV